MSSGGGEQTTTTTRQALPEHQRAINQAINKARGGLGRSFVGKKPLVAGANEDITAGQDAARSAAGVQNQLAQQGMGLLGNFANIGAGTDQIMNQRMQQLQDQFRQNLSSAMTGVRTGATQAGQAGSSRQGIAEGVAAGQIADATAQAQTQALMDAEQRRMQATQAAMGALPMMQQAQLAGANTLGAIGMQSRDIQNQLLQEPLMRQQAELQRLQGLSNIVSQQTSPWGTTTSTTETGGGGNFFQGALGGAMAGGDMFGGWGALGGGLLGGLASR